MSELLASGLEKSYRKRKVVSSLSLSIASGEVVGLLGPNGAGKTTAFYMIVGLVPCDGGRIELDGEDITSLPMHARARRGLGYLPQEPSIFRRMPRGAGPERQCGSSALTRLRRSRSACRPSMKSESSRKPNCSAMLGGFAASARA